MESEDRDLLAALRAFDVLLGAGIGLESVLINLARGGYGAISTDMERIMKGVNDGRRLEDELTRAATRTKSTGYKRLLTTLKTNVTSNTDLIEDLRRQADREEEERTERIEKYIEALEGMPTGLLTVGMLGPIMLPLVAVMPYLFTVPVAGITAPSPATANMISMAGYAVSVIIMAMIGLKAHTRDPGV
jgi:pilus assembly protein TadC